MGIAALLFADYWIFAAYWIICHSLGPLAFSFTSGKVGLKTDGLQLHQERGG